MSLRLTDPRDAFFYFSLLLTEEDFISLKSEQNLRVDFPDFPSMLSDLASNCEDGNYAAVLTTSATFDPVLEFSKKERYVSLRYLELKLRKGTDSQVSSLFV